MLTIGKLGKAAGVKVPTIRYYEQIGLLPPPKRSEGNQRLYDARALDRLAFIRQARELGFPLEAVRELPCAIFGRGAAHRAPDTNGIIH